MSQQKQADSQLKESLKRNARPRDKPLRLVARRAATHRLLYSTIYICGEKHMKFHTLAIIGDVPGDHPRKGQLDNKRFAKQGRPCDA